MALFLPGALAAESGESLRAVPLPVAVTGCDGGLINDDGSFEDTVYAASMVTRFQPPGVEARFSTICVCWQRSGGTPPPTIDYDLVVLAADGPGGEPGTELARLAASASGVSAQARFFEHDVAALDVEVPSEPFYLGVATDWGASLAFLCTDEDGPGGQPTYLGDTGGAWRPFDTAALGVRAGVHAAGGCSPGPHRLCIDHDPSDRRFSVTLSYDTVAGGGAAGDALATPLESLGIRDGGIFSFFTASNPEVLVKVLDGCSFNDHFWVFFAATTTVGFEMTVSDTMTGAQRRYTNEDEHKADPVTDLAAFPCP